MTRTRSVITLVAAAILAVVGGLQLWTTSRPAATLEPTTSAPLSADSSAGPPSAAAAASATAVSTVAVASSAGSTPQLAESTPSAGSTLQPLPSPRTEGTMSLEEALRSRRSVRAFAATPLTTEEVGQLLWAAQGVTDEQGHRTAPSAGALYPLEVYAVTAAGTSRYAAREHALVPLNGADLRVELRAAAFDQEPVEKAPLVLAITAVPDRATWKYGDRTMRYVYLEAGHAAENVLLGAVALGLGAVPVGAFDDARVAALLRLPAGETPVYLIAIGHPAAPDR